MTSASTVDTARGRHSAGGEVENRPIGIEESDLAVRLKTCSFEEVARSRPDVEVARSDVPAILLHSDFGRASPDPMGKKAQHHRVIDPQEPLSVEALTAIGGVVPVHAEESYQEVSGPVSH
jgi:hypothetical protein